MMKTHLFRWSTVLIVLLFVISACVPATPTAAPEPTNEPPQVEVSEVSGGTRIVSGSVTYTNAFFTEGAAQPMIILEDQGGFVTRDRKFIIPIESQVIGEITSDFYTSPFTYKLTLPIEPNGTLHDVDHDGNKDAGVMVFAVAYWTNTWGDPFLERRDLMGGAWSSAYASTKVSDSKDSYLEVFGGKYLVYAPDGEQQFPSDFGADKKLFTDDDPIVDLPAGWSVVDMDQSPFAIDRSEKPTVDLIEPEGSALDDFSQLSYTEAFDKMLEKFKNEYAFTEFKQIDWDAKGQEFRPRFEDAEKKKDPHLYALALRDFLWSIPDTHVGFDQTLLQDDFINETSGGLGFAMRETDDGKTIAVFILDGGPASAAGMKWGAEIISLDGKPVSDVVAATVPWSSPFSNASIARLQQLRYALRFKLDKGQVDVTFKNPDEAEQTVKMDVVAERDSFSFSSFYRGQNPTALPVEFDVLPSGYGYIKINSFLDNDVLSIQVWERAIKYFNDNQVPGVILDLRINGGGSGWLADQMAAYFFDKEIIVGNTARYDQSSGDFYMDPGDETLMIPPRPELQYSGPVVVMVGPACASACEFFSYDMTINKRAEVISQYSSDGAGGSVEQFLMPESIYTQMTIGRAVDAQGNIHLEGKGVVPTVKVPVTAETLLKEANCEDVILDAAVAYLDNPTGSASLPPAAAAPKLTVDASAESALTSGTQFLEELAKEQYQAGDYSKPGTLTYTINLAKSKDLMWAYGWCATSADLLKQNLENMTVIFNLDGQEIPAAEMAVFDTASGGQQCKYIYGLLSDWPVGQHHLTITSTFNAKMNDGSADYEPGDYILDYTVNVNN